MSTQINRVQVYSRSGAECSPPTFVSANLNGVDFRGPQSASGRSDGETGVDSPECTTTNPFRTPECVDKAANLLIAPGAPARLLIAHPPVPTRAGDVLADGGPPKIPRKKSTVRLCFVDEDKLSNGMGGESSTAIDAANFDLGAATEAYAKTDAKKCKTPGPTPGEKRKKTPATGGIGCFAVKRRRIKSRRRRDKRPVSHFKDIKKGVGAQVETITRNIMLLD